MRGVVKRTNLKLDFVRGCRYQVDTNLTVSLKLGLLKFMKMLHCYVVVFLIILFLIKTVLLQTVKSIVVMEYQSLLNSKNSSPQDILNANADRYIQILDDLAKDHNIILVIFPEGTLDAGRGKRDLKSFSTKLDKSKTPCIERTDSATFLKKLSCAARTYGVTMILNVIQHEVNNTFFSSDIIINSSGTIIYNNKKEERLGEPDLHHKAIPFEIPARRSFTIAEIIGPLVVPSTFMPTSLLTGFQFSYEKMINMSSYKSYLICSNWISQLPFLTSLQVHQMWAQEFNITLFFSGANNPKAGQGGTGIYHAIGGPLLMDILPRGGTKPYIYNFLVDTIPGSVYPRPEEKDVDTLAKEMDHFSLSVDPDLLRYKSVTLSSNSSSYINTSFCYENKENYFCCEFSGKFIINSTTKSKRHYVYHLVAYKGEKTYYSIFKPGGVEVCAVIACLNESLSSCGRRFSKYEEISWPLTFENLTIKAEFAMPYKEKIYYSSQFPNSLLSSIRPIHPNFTSWTQNIVLYKNTKRLQRVFAITEPQNRILTFAIFARNFSIKGKERSYKESKSKSSRILCTFIILSNFFVLKFL